MVDATIIKCLHQRYEMYVTGSNPVRTIFFNFKTNKMTELTIEMAMDIANKTSYKDWVKHFRPDWSDDECDFYIWEYTSFPFGFKDVIKQLNEQLT